MIQRIQSIYLLLVSVLMGLTIGSPLLTVKDSMGNFLDFTSLAILNGVEVTYPTFAIAAVGGLSALIALIEIFLYKKRNLQLKLGRINMVLIASFYIVFGVYFYFAQQELGIVLDDIEYGFIYPFVAFIFNVLSQIKINADVKLIRSLDRIR